MEQLTKAMAVPDTEENRIRFRIPVEIIYTPSPEIITAVKTFESFLLSRRYSPDLIKTYMEVLGSF
ncbi:MAG: hypothetical protein IPP89_19915 [Saprospiraceae bacterium]|nr:hypothetical protein [Candidatus Brachybacter algidus]MBL0121157.1 hypothetical protein [Candidatus Brachybacter algidus]